MMMIDDSPTCFLPRDMISSILLRLSFKSVLVCKLVSKEWLSIIKDPGFVKRYRDKSMAICVNGERLYGFFFVQDKKPKRFPKYTAGSLFQTTFGDNPKLLSGPSDNVVCIMGPNNIIFYTNLLTGESYTFEDAPPLSHFHCYGFGYDPYGDEYKLLIVCRQSSLRHCEGIRMDIAEQDKENSVFWVFSFTSHEWKSLNGFPYSERDWLSNESKSQSVGGFLHWVFYHSKERRFLIVTYNMHTCRFGEMAAPNGYNTGQAILSELDGNLCFLYGEAYEVWVMKEYGVAKSWTKLFTFHSIFTFMRSYFDVFEIAYMAPYVDEGGRQVLLFVCNHDKRLHWYDVTNGELGYTTRRVKPRKL